MRRFISGRLVGMGVLNPGLWASSSPWSVGDWATQQVMSTGLARDASYAAPIAGIAV